MAEVRRGNWRHSDSSSSGSGRRTRGTRLFRVLAVIMLLLGVLAGVYLFLGVPPRPKFFMLVLTEYRDPWPPNAFGDQDRTLLTAHTQLPGEGHAQVREADAIKKELKKLANLDSNGTCMVLLSALARQGPNEKLYILPGDARPEAADSEVKFSDILDALRECPARNKLLILDVMRPLHDPRYGIVAHDPARLVLRELENNQDERLLVLTACSPGQFTVASEELELSVFSYYLDQGLKGYADGFSKEGFEDNVLTVRELAAYVSSRVQRWTRDNRVEMQTPMLIAPKENKKLDFPLITLDTRPRRAGETPVLRERAYPETLLKAWSERDKHLQDPSLRIRLPLALLDLNARLLKAEAFWRAGRDDDGEKQIIESLSAFQSAHSKLGKPRQVEFPISLAYARVTESRGWKPDEKTLKPFRDQVDRIIRLVKPPMKPEPKPADPTMKPVSPAAEPMKELLAMAEKEKEAKKDPRQRHFGINLCYSVVTEALSLTRTAPSREALRVLSEDVLDKFLDTSNESSLPFFPAEVVALKLFLSCPKDIQDELLFRDALECAARSEEAAAQAQTWNWLREMTLETDKTRRQAVQHLLKGESLQARQKFADARREYLLVLEQARKVRRAWERVVDGLILVPGLMDFVSSDPQADDTWERQLESMRRLSLILEKVPTKNVSDECDAELRVSPPSVKFTLAEMLKHVEARAQRLISEGSRQTIGSQRIWQEIQLLLRHPLLQADTRKKLWETGHALARTLCLETLKSDFAEDDVPKKEDVNLQPPIKDTPAGELNQGLKRVEHFLLFLKFADVDIKALEKRLTGKPDLRKPDSIVSDLQKEWRQLDGKSETSLKPKQVQTR